MKLLILIICSNIFLYAKWERVENITGKSSLSYLYSEDDSYFFRTKDGIYKVSKEIAKTQPGSIDSLLIDFVIIGQQKVWTKGNKKYLLLRKNSDIWSKIIETEDFVNYEHTIDSLDLLIPNHMCLIENKVMISANQTLYFSNSFDNNWKKVDTEMKAGELFLSGEYIFNLQDYDGERSGFWLSSDNGETWEQRNEGLFEGVTARTFFAKGDTLYIGTQKIGLFYSYNLGKNWEYQGAGIPSQITVNDIFANDSLLFVATNEGLYKSTNAGRNFENVSFGKFSPEPYDNFSNNIKLINNKLYLSTWNGMYLSEDLGETWKPFVLETNKIFCRELLKRDNNLFFLSNINGIYEAEENGENWRKFSDSLYKVNYDPRYFYKKDDIIFTKDRSFPDSKDFIFSTNNGETWNESNSPISAARSVEFLYKKIILFKKGGIYESFDNTNTWQEIETNLDELIIRNIDFTTKIDDVIYLFTDDYGVFYSDDEGFTWDEFIGKEDELFNDSYLFMKKISNKYYLSNEKGLFYSNDLINWQKMSSLPNEINEFDVLNGVYVAKSASDFLFSLDDGESWNKYNDGLFSRNYDDNYLGEMQTLGDLIFMGQDDGLKYLNVQELINTSVENNYLYTKAPYPNPTNDKIKIEITHDNYSKLDINDIEIFTINGRKVDNIKLTIDRLSNYRDNLVWDCSKNKPGVYLINVKYGNKARTEKVIVE